MTATTLAAAEGGLPPTVAVPADPAAEPLATAPSRAGRLLRSPSFLVGAVIVLFWVFCAVFGPLVVPYDPYGDDLLNTLAPPSAAQEAPHGTL